MEYYEQTMKWLSRRDILYNSDYITYRVKN